MKKFFIVLVSLVAIGSCQKKEEVSANVKKDTAEVCTTKEKKFEMYAMSEMASLMEQMYAHNKQLRLRIKNGDTIGTFPKFFNKIYAAKMTSPSDNDAFFKENAKKFIAAQQLIYTDTKNLKENFNKVVDACITCHKSKCGGPIPRIKKLYIK